MRAALLCSFDVPPLIRDMPLPFPAAGEVRIAVQATGVSLVDALIAAGRYQARPDLPWIPGSECAGVVEALGAGVTGLAVGDRVCGLGWGRVTAEYACLPAQDLVRIPDTLSISHAAVLRVAYTTAWHALVDRARARSGERLLVLGASGAVGAAAVAIGASLGLDVTAVSRRRGAIGGLNAVSLENLSGEYDIIFDPVGGDVSVSALALLSPGGRFCVVGFAAGAIPSVAFNRILLREAVIIGVNVGLFTLRDPAAARRNFEHILALTSHGLALPQVEHRFGLVDVADAYALAASGAAEGRIIITI